MFFPALGRELPVVYTNVRLDGQAHWQSGNVKATIAPDLLKASAISDLEHPKFVDNFDGLKNFIKTARSNLDELPLMLNTLPSYQNANFGTLAVMLTEINVSKDRTTASMMALERMPEGIYLPFTKTGIVFDPLSMQPFKETQLDLSATADVTDVQLPITFKKGNATGSEGTYVTFDCNGLKVFHVEGFHKFSSSIITPSPTSGPDVVATFSADVKSLRQFVIKVTIPKFTIAGIEDVAFEINDAMIDYSDSENPTTLPASYFTEMGETAPTKKETWKGIHIGNLAISLPTLPMKDKVGNPYAFTARDLIYDRGNGFSGTFYINAGGKADINVKGFRFSLDEFNLRLKKNSVQDLNFLGGMAIPVLQDDKGALKYKATFNTNATTDQAKLEFAIQLQNDITLEVPLLSLAKCQLKQTSVVKMRNRDGRWSVFANLQGSFDVGIQSPRLSVGLPFEGWKFGDNLTGPVTGTEELPMAFKAFDLDGGSDSSLGSGSSGGKKKLSGFPLTVDDITFKSEGGVYQLGLTVGVALGSGTSAFEAKGGIIIESKLNFAKLISKKPWEGIEFNGVDVNKLSVDADMSAFIFKGYIQFMKNDPVYGDGFKADNLSFRVKGTPGGQTFNLTAKGIFGNKDNYNYFSVDADVTMEPGIPFIASLYLNKFGGGVYFNMQQVRDGNGPTRYVPSNGIMGFKARVGVGLENRKTFDALGEFIIEFGNEWAFRSLTLNVKAGVLNDVPSINPTSDNPYRNSKIVGNCTMIYDNVNQTLTANMSVSLQHVMVQGSGSLSMFFNLKDKSDWYVRLGTPQTPIRVGWGPVRVGMYIMVGKGIGDLPNVGDVVPELASMGVTEAYRRNPTSSTGKGIAFGLNYSMKQSVSIFVFSASIKAAFGIDALLKDNACNSTGWNGWVMEGQAYAYVGARVDIKVNLLFAKGTYNIAKLALGAVLKAKLPAPLSLSGKLAGQYSILNGLVKGRFRVGFSYNEGGEPCTKQSYPTSPAVGQPLVEKTYPESGDEIQVFDDIVISSNFEMDYRQSYDFEYAEGMFKTYYYKCRFVKVDVMQGNKTLATMKDGKFINVHNGYTTFMVTPLSALPEKTDLTLVISAEAYNVDDNGNILETVGTETRTVNFRTGPRPERVYNPMIKYNAPVTNQKYWFKGYVRPKVTLKQNGYEYLFDPKPNGIESEYKCLIYKKVGNDSTLQHTFNLTSTFDGTEVLYYEQENAARCGCSSYTKTENNPKLMENPNAPLNCRLYGNCYETKTYYTPKRCKYTDTVPSRSFRFDGLNDITLDKSANYRIEIIRRPIKFQQQKAETTTNVGETTTVEEKMEDDDEIETTVQTRSLSVKKGNTQEIAIIYTSLFSTSRFTELAEKISISGSIPLLSVSAQENGYAGYDYFSADRIISGFKVEGAGEPFDEYDQMRVLANCEVETNTGGDEYYKYLKSTYSSFSYLGSSQKGTLFDLAYNRTHVFGQTETMFFYRRVLDFPLSNYLSKNDGYFYDSKAKGYNYGLVLSLNSIFRQFQASCVLNSINRSLENLATKYCYDRKGRFFSTKAKAEYGRSQELFNCQRANASILSFSPYNPAIYTVSGTLNYTIPKTVPESFDSKPTDGGTVRKYNFSFTPPKGWNTHFLFPK